MPAIISGVIGGEDQQIVSPRNSELDKQIADGLPLQSLTLINGNKQYDAYLLCREIMHGVIKQGLSVNLFTTGNTTRNFIRQIGLINRAVSHYFATAYLKEFPNAVVGFKWNKAEIENILRHLIAGIRHSTAQAAII